MPGFLLAYAEAVSWSHWCRLPSLKWWTNFDELMGFRISLRMARILEATSVLEALETSNLIPVMLCFASSLVANLGCQECLRRAGFELWDLGGADRSPMMQYKPQVALDAWALKCFEGLGLDLGHLFASWDGVSFEELEQLKLQKSSAKIKDLSMFGWVSIFLHLGHQHQVYVYYIHLYTQYTTRILCLNFQHNFQGALSWSIRFYLPRRCIGANSCCVSGRLLEQNLQPKRCGADSAGHIDLPQVMCNAGVME